MLEPVPAGGAGAAQAPRAATGHIAARIDRLLICRGYRSDTGTSGFLLGAPKEGARRFTARVALAGEPDSAPRAVELQPLRRTVQVRLSTQPGQNSQETHDSQYVLRDASTPRESDTT